MTQQPPDLSGLNAMVEQMAGYADQARESGSAAHEMAARVQAYQERLQTLQGSASDDDERVHATVSPTVGFSALRLDPKAMRMAPEDLASQIISTVKLAEVDLSEKQEALDAELGMPTARNLDQAYERLAALRGQLGSGVGDLASMMEKMRNPTP